MTDNVGLGSRVAKSFTLQQDEANPSLVFAREEVESLMMRKWKKLRKELVVDDAVFDPGKAQHHQSTRRLRAVRKNPLFDYRASIQKHLEG